MDDIQRKLVHDYDLHKTNDLENYNLGLTLIKK